LSDTTHFASQQVIGMRDAQEDRVMASALPSISTMQARKFLAASSATIHERTKENIPGSTFSGAIVTDKGDVVTAQLGDSFSAIVTYDPTTHQSAIRQLSAVHKPGQNRIDYHDGSYQEGGVCVCKNGTYKLTVKRAFGDSEYGLSVGKDADVSAHAVFQEARPGIRQFLIVGSDGAAPAKSCFEFYAQIIAQKLRTNPTCPSGELVHALVSHARNHPYNRDNVSIALAEVLPGKCTALAVFDGHGKTFHGHETSEQACSYFSQHIKDLNEKGVDAGTRELIQALPEEAQARIHSQIPPQKESLRSLRGLLGIRPKGSGGNALG